MKDHYRNAEFRGLKEIRESGENAGSDAAAGRAGQDGAAAGRPGKDGAAAAYSGRENFKREGYGREGSGQYAAAGRTETESTGKMQERPGKTGQAADSLPKKSILSVQPDLRKFRLLTAEEKETAEVMPESSTFFKDAMKRFRRNPLGMGALIMLAAVLLLIVFSAFFCPYTYEGILTLDGVRDITAKNLAPLQYSARELEAMAAGTKIFPHLFGTDELCRDYFARVMTGTRISLAVGIFASIIVMVIGSVYGAVSGLIGGKTDMIMMRIVDIIYSLPDMLLVILLSVVLGSVFPKNAGGILGKLGPNMLSLFIVFALLYWVSMARLVRGQILSIRENDYVLAARMIRTPTMRMVTKQILPNCISIIFISATMQIPSAIFTESYLSFVGLGVRAPMPSLGVLANAARSSMQMYPYKLVFPAIMIALIVLSFNLLGDALRDAFDPKQKH